MPKARSLHIAVNRLNPASYLYDDVPADVYTVFVPEGDDLKAVGGERYLIGWMGPLGNAPEYDLGCEKDADDMAELARQRGIDEDRISVLKTRDATAENVTRAIEQAAAELEPGDLFLVTYSGHGAHAKDSELRPDEAEGYDETWCLYDRMFLDDEQRYLYSKFRPGVRILVLLDSCHSGSGTRSGKRQSTGDDDEHNVRIRSAPAGLDKAIYEYGENARFYDGIQARLEQRIDEERKTSPDIGKRNFSVVSLSACQDNQKAKGDDVKGGWFTNAVTAAFEKGEFRNYIELKDAVKNELKRQHPNATQEPNFDHGLSGSWALADATAKGRMLSESEWEKEFEQINSQRAERNADRRRKNARREKSDPPKPPLSLEEPLSPAEKAALRDLEAFLREEPLRIGGEA